MLFEILTPLKLILPEGARAVTPGELLDLPERLAWRFLEKGRGKARPITIAAGDLVWWRSADGRERGPATVGATFVDGEQMWICLEYEQREYLIRASLVIKVSVPVKDE